MIKGRVYNDLFRCVCDILRGTIDKKDVICVHSKIDREKRTFKDGLYSYFEERCASDEMLYQYKHYKKISMELYYNHKIIFDDEVYKDINIDHNANDITDDPKEIDMPDVDRLVYTSVRDCVIDIVDGKIEYDDVEVIISSDYVIDRDSFKDSFKNKMNELFKCLRIDYIKTAMKLWDDGKITNINPYNITVYSKPLIKHVDTVENCSAEDEHSSLGEQILNSIGIMILLMDNDPDVFRIIRRNVNLVLEGTEPCKLEKINEKIDSILCILDPKIYDYEGS